MPPETKDFSHEGTVHFKMNGGLIDPVSPIWGKQGEWTVLKESKITDIEFLMPARVTFTAENGEKRTYMAYVDVANKKACDEKGNPYFVDEIFTFLDEKNNLSEDFFKASDEITARAAEVQQGFTQPE